MVLFWLPRKRLLSLFCGVLAIFVVFYLTIYQIAPIMADAQKIQEPVCRVDTAEKQVALSFDVEWTDVQTGELLRILKKYRAKATFFVVGRWAETHRESVLQIAMADCELGSHSMAHSNMQKLSPEEQAADLQACNRVLEQITGKKPGLFRAPYGAYSPELLSAARGEGMLSIQWDIDSLDWKNLPPEQICNQIVEQIRPGSIVRFQSSALNTPTALESLLEILQNEGYTFVTVSELF